MPMPPNQETDEPTSTGAQVELVEEVFDEPSSEAVILGNTQGERLLPVGLLEIGDPKAPVNMLLFTEHHCAYCKEFQDEQMPLLLQEFVAQGKLRIQIGILPLKKYLDSDLSAMGLLCASAQNKGLAMHAALFEKPANADSIMKTTEQLTMDTKAFAACLKSEDTKTMLTAMRSLAQTLDVTLVPTFFIDGEKSVGLPYYADLRGEIEKVLAK